MKKQFLLIIVVIMAMLSNVKSFAQSGKVDYAALNSEVKTKINLYLYNEVNSLGTYHVPIGKKIYEVEVTKIYRSYTNTGLFSPTKEFTWEIVKISTLKKVRAELVEENARKIKEMR